MVEFITMINPVTATYNFLLRGQLYGFDLSSCPKLTTLWSLVVSPSSLRAAGEAGLGVEGASFAASVDSATLFSDLASVSVALSVFTSMDRGFYVWYIGGHSSP